MYGELDIPLKNKIDEFQQFKTKIFFRTIFMVLLAVSCVYLLYAFLLKGNFANWIVAIYQKIFGLDYNAAWIAYIYSFRNHIEIIVLFTIVIIFLIIFCIYLKWLTKYFMEINKGIDALIDEKTGEILLSPELSATEKKINTLKHILEKQKLDAQLTEQRKNDLIVYLAHDLKTPLASVIGYLNLLHDEGEISDELRERYLSISLDKAERLEDLINEFFEIAKYNLSTITLQYSRINLTRLFEMLLYEFQPMFQEKNLSCNLSIAEDTMLRCDANKLQRVFDNLLRNAVIYSFDSTVIDITVIEQGENIVITFSNHGDTIPEEKLERLFEQFYRLDDSRSTSGGGAGLGLAIAKQIIELHNGTVVARCENEKIEFEVILPAS